MSNRAMLNVTTPLLSLSMRVDLAPGQIEISLDPKELATLLCVDTARINPDLPNIKAPFRLRKRGVETKIILTDTARPVDAVLLANIANAHLWFEMLRTGQTYTEIAKATGTSKHRIQKILKLAFLAPDIVRDVMNGQQPLGFTSDWCLRHTLPSDWDEQRRLLATL